MSNQDIKILIVDDDENNRFCAVRNLKRFIGYSNYAEADDGSSGLSYLEKNSDVDIILLDRMMSGVNGLDMLKTMHEKLRYPDVEVIFQTGAVSKEEKKECLDAGSFFLLQKPYDDVCMAQLLHAVSLQIRVRRRIKKYMELQTEKPFEVKFEFKTVEEAEKISAQLAMCFPNPEAAVEPVYELLINAIEHGNLGLGYETK
jgi:CheY-like chemotaxis protein